MRNVVGFDLNPLAVIAARTNYLLALRELLKARDGEIDIPVYQADSVLTPARLHATETGKSFSFAFEGDSYRLRTSVGEFDVPAFFDDRTRMDRLTSVLDDSVEAGLSESGFIRRLEKDAALTPEERAQGETALTGLYRRLRELHDTGLNGVWARIIKNAFAPIFLEPGDYVVGNPPWVNWEHLPDEYRRSTMPLWEHYGLFPKRDKAMHTILGAAKYDISMLMTYVAADRYLKRGGKLGFVLTQSLFKTSGAGQGFRRFTLPDKTPFGPLVVEDMVELKPFEGANNRTAVAVFAKGRAVSYPVSYQYWKKRGTGRGSAIGFDTPYETVTTEKITFRAWHAEPVNVHDVTSSWLAARRKALHALHNVLGHSPYVGREGTNTGGANAVYWLEVTGDRPGGQLIVANVTERAKNKVANTQAAVEGDLIYPLLRGADVRRWQARPSIHILLTHEHGYRLKAMSEERMQVDFPKVFAYVRRFESMLRRRPAFKRYFKWDAPFYSIFNIGDYTFAPWKVVWREQASSFTAAVVGPSDGKPVVPDHKLMLVAAASEDEAHYLCAALNSTPSVFAVAAYTVQIQMNTHVLDNVAVPKYNGKNKTHRTLSRLSIAAHRAAMDGQKHELKSIEEKIDQTVAGLWGLTQEALDEIKHSLEET